MTVPVNGMTGTLRVRLRSTAARHWQARRGSSWPGLAWQRVAVHGVAGLVAPPSFWRNVTPYQIAAIRQPLGRGSDPLTDRRFIKKKGSWYSTLLTLNR